MCGFFGLVNADPARIAGAFNIRHRGPDSEGEYRDDELYLKHFRLAILGEEKYARQPMVSRDGSIVVVFNGEIYNYREIAEFLDEPDLASNGDTRVLVEFLSKYSLDKLDMLNGMFAMVIYNKQERSLSLIRDRFGIKPLYYLKSGNSLYFASEIKCFRGMTDLKLDREKVTDYLDMGIYPFGKETFYRGIVQVEPGTWVQYRDEEVKENIYYDLKKECMHLAERKLSVEEYESLLSESIRIRLRSDVPISIHYSGGTDSTALLLKIKEVWGWDYPIVAYTMGYCEEEFDESRLTEEYCSYVGVENRKVFLSPEEVPEYARVLHNFEDEPYAGIPVIAYYKLNMQERKSDYIVSIEGQGGDETFGGYLYHIYMAMYDLHRLGKHHSLLEKLLDVTSTTLDKVIKVSEKLTRSGFSSHTDLTDLRSKAEKPVTMFMDWLRTIQVYDILQNKIPRTLRFHDRASMACGREVRFPLLDHNVLAYGLAFDHSLKYREGLSKYPLRMIIKRHMKQVYSVPKRSVVTPQTVWLRGRLKDWAFERIHILKRSNFLPETYFRVFDNFYNSNDMSNSFYIWQLINLSFFFEKSLDTTVA